ncbi:MAG: copper amine oxidase N-terminal domain-containing protein [Syntrophomonadaceae bacterium]|jgi:hypothetical protein|nr:copper amine oxidase N-terminal domain-containing protein [Syntrophomonadaceae bacterium]
MKKHLLTTVLALVLCLTLVPAFSAPAFAADELKNPQNVAVSIPGAPGTTFTLENVFDEYMTVKAWIGGDANIYQYMFFFDGSGSVSCDKPLDTWVSILLPDGAGPAPAPSVHRLGSGEKLELKHENPGDFYQVSIEVFDDGSLGVIYGETGEVIARVYFLVYQSLDYGLASFEGELRPVSELAVTPLVPALIAKPAPSTVLVNGESKSFGAYNIEGNNYFKLRDLAYVLNGTEKHFEIGWDGANNAITLTSGLAYTVVGGEMADRDESEWAAATGHWAAAPTTSKISLNGREANFTAYNIGGSNYFKLRDIGEAFDFSVTWNSGDNTIVIDTSKNYTAD